MDQTCIICYETTDSLQLSCGHSYCPICVMKMSTTEEGSYSLVCPLCRKTVCMNRPIQTVVCPVNSISPMISVAASSPTDLCHDVSCQKCNSFKDVSGCQDCRVNLCIECWDQVHSFRPMSSHTKKGSQVIWSDRYCQIHPSNEKVYYCSDHQVGVCHECAEHPIHSTCQKILIDISSRDNRQALRHQKTLATQRLASLDMELESSRPESHLQLSSDLRTKFSEYRDQLNRLEARLCTELEDFVTKEQIGLEQSRFELDQMISKLSSASNQIDKIESFDKITFVESQKDLSVRVGDLISRAETHRSLPKSLWPTLTFPAFDLDNKIFLQYGPKKPSIKTFLKSCKYVLDRSGRALLVCMGAGGNGSFNSGGGGSGHLEIREVFVKNGQTIQITVGTASAYSTQISKTSMMEARSSKIEQVSVYPIDVGSVYPIDVPPFSLIAAGGEDACTYKKGGIGGSNGGASNDCYYKGASNGLCGCQSIIPSDQSDAYELLSSYGFRAGKGGRGGPASSHRYTGGGGAGGLCIPSVVNEIREISHKTKTNNYKKGGDGARGPRGIDGPNGLKGLEGLKGPSGTPGPSGSSGYDGFVGIVSIDQAGDPGQPGEGFGAGGGAPSTNIPDLMGSDGCCCLIYL